MNGDTELTLHPDDFANGSTAKRGVALCLSGRGYQAMLFQAGCLWRLNELGWLPKIDCVSSVSSASITAALLGLRWKALSFDHNGVAREFANQIVEPLRRLASQTVEDWSVIGAALSAYSAGEIIANALDEYLYSGALLRQLPDKSDESGPRFVFAASNVEAESLVLMSRSRIWDSRNGSIDEPDMRLALAVAASASSPPWLSTMLKITDHGLPRHCTDNEQAEPRLPAVTLTDGSVLDSLGLEAVSDSYRDLLVSNGGWGPPREAFPPVESVPDSTRIIDVLLDRVRFAQRHELLRVLDAGDAHVGVYWDITMDDLAATVERARPYPLARTCCAVVDPPALTAIDKSCQEELINRGYAICDVAIEQSMTRNGVLSAQFGNPNHAGRHLRWVESA